MLQAAPANQPQWHAAQGKPAQPRPQVQTPVVKAQPTIKLDVVPAGADITALLKPKIAGLYGPGWQFNPVPAAAQTGEGGASSFVVAFNFTHGAPMYYIIPYNYLVIPTRQATEITLQPPGAKPVTFNYVMNTQTHENFHTDGSQLLYNAAEKALKKEGLNAKALGLPQFDGFEGGAKSAEQAAIAGFAAARAHTPPDKLQAAINDVLNQYVTGVAAQLAIRSHGDWHLGNATMAKATYRWAPAPTVIKFVP